VLWAPAGAALLWAAAAAAAVLGGGLLLTQHTSGVPGRPPLAAQPHRAAHSPAPAVPAPKRAGQSPTPASPTASFSPATEPVTPAAEALWLPVATAFARDFANPGTGHTDWVARVRRWTSGYLAGQYQQTDPHRIPAATLLAVKPVAAGGTSVTFVASYDTGLTLTGRVELGPTGWKVTSAQPATPGPGG
jgi:hypothetical protein